MMTRFFGAATLVLSLLFSTGSIGVRGAENDQTLTISQGVDADTLDPIKSLAISTYNVVGQMYDSLCFFDNNGNPHPDLAVSWRRVKPNVVEYHLRRGVSFWNGDPFTSADVKFTIEKIKDPSYKSTQGQYVNEITDVLTPDPYTVQFVTAKPTYLFPLIRQRVFIVDSRYWKEHGDAYMADHPMGTGPYMLKHWSRDDELSMDANPKYFLGTPKIAHVVFKVIPEDSSRVAALKTGAADLITNVPVQYADSINGSRNNEVVTIRSSRQLFVAFNLMQPGPQQNKLVRQAFNYAVDVPEVLKAVLANHGYPTLPIPANFHFYNPKIKGYPHDLAKAKQLLSQAGYPNGKGIDLVLNTPVGRYNADKEIAEAIAGQLSATGAKVTVKTWEWVSYLTAASHHELGSMYLLGWGGGHAYDPDAILEGVLVSSSVMSSWHNTQFDELADSARYELDAKKRLDDYSKAVKTAVDDAPWIFLFQYEDLYGASRRLVWQPQGDQEFHVYTMHFQ